MKKFVKHIVVFFGGLLLFVMAVIFSTNSIINSNTDLYILDKNVKHLVLGHSHPASSFNDALINATKNVASSGELFYYTYLKTKKILAVNKHVKTIFLEFTNNQITRDMEKWTKDEAQIVYRIPKYAPNMVWEDWRYITTKNPLAVLKTIPYIFKENVKTISKPKPFINRWGEYDYSQDNHIDSLQIALRQGTLEIQDVSILETINLEYLEKIIELCHEANVTLYLIRSPFHKDYLGINNETMFQDILQSRYSDILFLDFKDFPLNDKEYRDFDHLNDKGATKFSTFFNTLLKAKTFESVAPQDSINKKMTLIPLK